jgi:predicted DNA-binding protein
MQKRAATIAVRVSPEQKERLAEIAASERRTVSQVVLFMIEEGLAKRARRHPAAK